MYYIIVMSYNYIYKYVHEHTYVQTISIQSYLEIIQNTIIVPNYEATLLFICPKSHLLSPQPSFVETSS